MQHDHPTHPRPTSPGLLARERPFILGVAAAAVLFLILATLGAATDWWRIDESFTWDMIRDSWSSMIRRTMADVHPPLYYLALHAFYLLWPRPEAMQAFSMLMGLAALLAAALIGRLLRGARLGVLIALLWATFPFLLHYSQDARMYTMALFLETLGLLGWVMAPRRPRAGWALFVISLTASLYTQNLCLIFAAALIGGEMARCIILWYKKTYFTPPPIMSSTRPALDPERGFYHRHLLRPLDLDPAPANSKSRHQKIPPRPPWVGDYFGPVLLSLYTFRRLSFFARFLGGRVAAPDHSSDAESAPFSSSS